MKIVSARLELSSKVRQDGRQGLFLRLTKNRKMKRISTGLYARAKDFDKDAQFGHWIRKSDRQASGKNDILKQVLYKVETCGHYFTANNITPTLNEIAKYLKKEEKNTSFFPFCEKILQRQKDANQVNTYLKNKSSLKKLREFAKNPALDFRDITVEFLNEYENWLQKRGNSTNTVGKDLRILRAWVNKGIDENIIGQEYYPFRRFKIKTTKTNKKRLTESELQKFIELDVSIDTSIGRSHRYFLFSFFAFGLRFADLCCLRKKNISVNGQLKYNMRKTGEQTFFKLPMEAMNILKEFGYDNDKKSPNDFIFPLLEHDYKDPFIVQKRISSCNALVNKNLKSLAKLAGIEGFGFHSARHTFSSIALSRNIGVWEISKLLKHSSIGTTENYLDNFNKIKITNAIKKIYSSS